MKDYFSLMEKQCFRSHVGKLNCRSSPAGTTVDTIAVVIVRSVLEKMNEVIGLNICKEK